MDRPRPSLQRWIAPGLAAGALVLGIAVVARIVRNPETDDAIVTAVPDVRDSERGLAQARALDQAARAEAWTRAAAFAVSTGDLAQP